jgi:transposase
MRPCMSLTHIYLYPQAIDFRKSFRGISAIVECELGHNPFSGHLYVFTNKRRTKIKCLFWENNGFVLYYKRLNPTGYLRTFNKRLPFILLSFRLSDIYRAIKD